jgi:hypothetical protein
MISVHNIIVTGGEEITDDDVKYLCQKTWCRTIIKLDLRQFKNI